MMRILNLSLLAAVLAFTSCSEAPPEAPATDSTPAETAPPAVEKEKEAPQASTPPPAVPPQAAEQQPPTVEAAAVEAAAVEEKAPEPAAAGIVKVKIATSKGDIVLELDQEKAPQTVSNFLSYIEDGFFENTLFHRVMSGFMVQGGGFERSAAGDLEKKATKAPVQNEAKNGLKNARGTISMARTSNPHSATAQFFINHKDNDNLDYPSFDGWGYAVFGKVVEGLDVVDAIADVPTTTLAPGQGGNKNPVPMENVPAEDVVIQSITVVR